MLNLLFALNDRIPPKRRAAARGVYERAAYYWSRLTLGEDRFTEIEIETNTGCNRACRICPVSEEPRPDGQMDEELYHRVLGQLAAMGFNGRLSPVFYNEPLLDERLPRLMKAARDALPDSLILIFTNGSLLTTDRIIELVEAGVDTLFVSQYDDNVKGDGRRYRNAVSDLPKRFEKHLRYRTLGDSDPLLNAGGLIAVEQPITRDRCMQASRSAVLDYQGNVVLCCNDYHTQHTFGNVGEQDLLDIWNQPHFKALRRQLRHGDFRLDLCKACARGELSG